MSPAGETSPRSEFGRIVRAALPDPPSRSPRLANTITRDLQLILYGHNVGRFQMTVYKACVVNVGKGLCGCLEHLLRFFPRERDVPERPATDLPRRIPSPHIRPSRRPIRPGRSRKGESNGGGTDSLLFPIARAGRWLPPVCWQNLDRGCLSVVLRAEDSALFVAAQIFAERELPIDYLTLPMFPGLSHARIPSA